MVSTSVRSNLVAQASLSWSSLNKLWICLPQTWWKLHFSLLLRIKICPHHTLTFKQSIVMSRGSMKANLILSNWNLNTYSMLKYWTFFCISFRGRIRMYDTNKILILSFETYICRSLREIILTDSSVSRADERTWSYHWASSPALTSIYHLCQR